MKIRSGILYCMTWYFLIIEHSCLLPKEYLYSSYYQQKNEAVYELLWAFMRKWVSSHDVSILISSHDWTAFVCFSIGLILWSSHIQWEFRETIHIINIWQWCWPCDNMGPLCYIPCIQIHKLRVNILLEMYDSDLVSLLHLQFLLSGTLLWTYFQVNQCPLAFRWMELLAIIDTLKTWKALSNQLFCCGKLECPECL